MAVLRKWCMWDKWISESKKHSGCKEAECKSRRRKYAKDKTNSGSQAAKEETSSSRLLQMKNVYNRRLQHGSCATEYHYVNSCRVKTWYKPYTIGSAPVSRVITASMVLSIVCSISHSSGELGDVGNLERFRMIERIRKRLACRRSVAR